MGRKNSHLARRVKHPKTKAWIWIEACAEKYLPDAFADEGSTNRRAGKEVPCHLGMTTDPTRVTCRTCGMLMDPDVARKTAGEMEREALNGPHRLDTVVLLVTREEVHKIHVPALEPSPERAELIATLNARGRGAVAARTKPGSRR